MGPVGVAGLPSSLAAGGPGPTVACGFTQIRAPTLFSGGLLSPASYPVPLVL